MHLSPLSPLSIISGFIDKTEVGNSCFNQNIPKYAAVDSRDELLSSKNLTEWINKSADCNEEMVDDCASLIVLGDIPHRKSIAYWSNINQDTLIKKLFKEAIQKNFQTTEGSWENKHIHDYCLNKYNIVPTIYQRITQIFESIYIKAIVVIALYLIRAPLKEKLSFYKERSVAQLLTFKFGKTALKILEIANNWKVQVAFALSSIFIPTGSYLSKAVDIYTSFFLYQQSFEILYGNRLMFALWSCNFVFSRAEEYWIEESANRFSKDVRAFIDSKKKSTQFLPLK